MRLPSPPGSHPSSKAELANDREREKQASAMESARKARQARNGQGRNADATAIGRYLALLSIEARIYAVADALSALMVVAVEHTAIARTAAPI